MTGVVVVLHELLEVVWEPNYVKFEHALVEMDARRVHVPMNDALVVERGHRGCQLPEQTQRVEHRHRSFAELLPHADVLRSLRLERHRIYVVQEVGLAHEVEQVGVVYALQRLDVVVEDELLADRHGRKVDD